MEFDEREGLPPGPFVFAAYEAVEPWLAVAAVMPGPCGGDRGEDPVRFSSFRGDERRPGSIKRT